jgi:hypothetical protein
MELVELDFIIRCGVRSDLPALEWEGAYRHFRRLYADTYYMMEKGQALIWVAEAASTMLIGQVFVSLSGSRIELSDGEARAYIYGFGPPQLSQPGVGTRCCTPLRSGPAQFSPGDLERGAREPRRSAVLRTPGISNYGGRSRPLVVPG